MPIQFINVGGYANDGTGDSLREAFDKVNANFGLLEAGLSGALNLGSGVGIYAHKVSTDLAFKSLTSVNHSVVLTPSDNTIDLDAKTVLENDHAPKLGATLNLNGHYIYGGDVQTTVHGVNVPILAAFIAASIETNNLTLDLGTFQAPTGRDYSIRGYDFDFGSVVQPTTNSFNFGGIA